MDGIGDLNIYQGDDYIAQVTVLDSTGAAADLTGYTAEAEIRTGLGANGTLAATFACSISGNLINITLTHDQTKTLTRETYVWDVQVVSATGWITTLLAGSVAVTQEVTKLYA
jgi:hypothetical protein